MSKPPIENVNTVNELSTDIYISYNSSDMRIVKELVGMLEDKGRSVFLDRSLSKDKAWKEELKAALEKVKLVLVLWSKASVQDEYVLMESEMGRNLGKLLSVTLDGEIARSFASMNTFSLMEWDGGPNHPALIELLKVIEERLGNGDQRSEDIDRKEPAVVFTGHKDAINSVSFSPDGMRLATAGYDRTVRIWDTESGKEIAALKGHEDVIYGVAFSPDGDRVASASQDQTVRIWDTTKFYEFGSLKGHEDTIGSVAFDGDGKRLVTASSDGTVRIWDMNALTSTKVLTGHEGKVYGAVFSPDGKQIVSTGQDGTIRIWDAETGRQISMLTGNTDAVYSAAFHPKGQQLATAGEDRKIRIWDISSLAEVAVLTGHEGGVYAVAFSPDGVRLASASEDGTARIWNTSDFSPSTIFTGHKDRVNAVAFRRDGRFVATGSLDGYARIYELGQEAQEQKRDQVKWVDDEPAEEDLLNREVLAKALAIRLRRFRDDKKHLGLSFLIHVDGPWGSGKSTLLQLLRKQLVSMDGDSAWLFIKFDAWRQSHIGPPWWALLTALRNGMSDSMNMWERIKLRLKESVMRLKRAGAPYGAAIILLVLIGVLVFVAIRPAKFDWKNWKTNIDVVLAIVSAISVFWVGSKIVSRFLFWDSVTGAHVFEQSHTDPMDEVADHFRWLIHHRDKSLLFIIDDLDRCPDDYVVGLLDAVQTLMRSTWKRAAKESDISLYFVVAADGRWIRKSYENAYDIFTKTVDEPGRPLGYLFLDKLFQLTVQVPFLSQELQKSFLKELLAVRTEEEKKELESSEADAREKLERSESEMEAVKVVQQAHPEVRHKLTTALVEKLTTREFEKATEHALQKFAPLLEPNPRSMKRFVMAYSMSRAVRSLEGSWVDTDPLALWTILQIRWPELAERLRRSPGNIEYVGHGEHLPESDGLRNLFNGQGVKELVNFKHGGPLTEKLIRACCGTAD